MCWFGLVLKASDMSIVEQGFAQSPACRVGALPSNNGEVQLAVGQSNVRSYLKRYSRRSAVQIYFTILRRNPDSRMSTTSHKSTIEDTEEPHLPSCPSIKNHVNHQWAHLGWLLVLSILVLNWWRRLAVIQSHAPQEANFVWLLLSVLSLSEFQQISTGLKQHEGGLLFAPLCHGLLLNLA